MIQNYLLSNCLLIIEDLNQKFDRHNPDEIKDYANTEFDESDLVFLLAYPFRNLTKVSMQGKNEDIKVKSLDFIVEVKYLYSTKSSDGQFTNKRSFRESFEKDFSWLVEEIRSGKKGKRAFVVGWFNIAKSFCNLMQLGQGSGNSPKVNADKLNYFPFLAIPNKDCAINEVSYRYEESVYKNESYTPDTIPLPDLKEGKVNCIFLGKKTDKFHFAIYY